MSVAVPDWLDGYLKRGFRLVFYPPGQKGPSGIEGKQWETFSHKAEDYTKWIEKHGNQPNVGTFLGHEISPGKFLADVDFDWQDGVRLAKKILPPTGFGFGRPSRSFSHVFFTTPEPVVNDTYKDIDNRTTFVELRGCKKDEGIGQQTMIPPSLHPDDERLEMRLNDEIGHSADLAHRVTLYAIACILYKYLKDKKLVHDTRLGAAGFLLKEGLSEDEVVLILSSVAELSGNDVNDVRAAVHSTSGRIKAHEPVKGRGELSKSIGKEGRQVINQILRWLGHEDFIYTEKGTIRPDVETNIVVALDKLDVKISYDEFNNHQYIRYNGYIGQNKPVISNRVWLDIQSNFQFRPSLEFYDIVTESLAYKNKFHPVKDYINNLQWDGTARVDEWLIKYGAAADSPYTRAVSAIVLIAAVRRIKDPGCKYDEMLILESEQGMLKSSAIQALCPDPEWFSDDLPLYSDAKEVIERTAGKWIIEASELSGLSARNVDHLKSMLARGKDESRMSYQRKTETFLRQFIIIGTTNSHKYLQDDTGNRRFWPVRVDRFDLAGIREDRDQLWAEAAIREESGESIRLDPSLYPAAAIQQERRRVEDPWEALLSARYEAPCSDGCIYPNTSIDARYKEVCEKCGYQSNGECRLTYGQIYTQLGVQITHQNVATNKRLISILRTLGFQSGAIRDPILGNTVRGWIKKGTKE